MLLTALLAACGGSGGGSTVPPSSDATLSGLTASAGALGPAFTPTVLSYVVGPSLLPGTTTVTATTASSSASLKVNGVTTPSGSPSASLTLPVGLTPVTILVTAADGVTQLTYTIVFQRSLSAQQAYLKASNTDAGDLFGYSVAASAGTLVVGAPGEASASANQADDSQADAGAAYVFVLVADAWVQQAYLKASVTGSDRFGHAVGVDGDTIVVGAFLEDSSATGVNGNAADDGATDSGAAYVFVRTAGVWPQQAYLKPGSASGRERV